MPARRYDTGRDALDFIATLSSLDDPNEIVTALRQKLLGFGFHAFLITGLPEYGDRIEPLVMVNGWPAGWFELYRSRSFADHDPIAAHCKTTVDPFAWSEIYHDASASERQREVMQRARDFSMMHGFCVPIHNEDGFQAVVTMAGDRPDLSRETRSAIHLMSIFAHSRAKTCARPTAPSARLSRREREVLTWFGLGQSTQGVADKLGLDPHTIQDYFKSAARKLRVRGRTHTVVEALRRQEITL